MTLYKGYDEVNRTRTYENGDITKDAKNCLHYTNRLKIKKRDREITTIQTSI